MYMADHLGSGRGLQLTVWIVLAVYIYNLDINHIMYVVRPFMPNLNSDGVKYFTTISLIKFWQSIADVYVLHYTTLYFN